MKYVLLDEYICLIIHIVSLGDSCEHVFSLQACLACELQQTGWEILGIDLTRDPLVGEWYENGR